MVAAMGGHLRKKCLALAKLVNKASYNLISGVEAIRNDDDDDDELTLTLSHADDVEYRVPG